MATACILIPPSDRICGVATVNIMEIEESLPLYRMTWCDDHSPPVNGLMQKAAGQADELAKK